MVEGGYPLRERLKARNHGIYTQFFQSAQVSSYYTIGAEVGRHIIWRLEGQPVDLGYYSVGLYVEQGNHYNSGHFQFGSGWKFLSLMLSPRYGNTSNTNAKEKTRRKGSAAGGSSEKTIPAPKQQHYPDYESWAKSTSKRPGWRDALHVTGGGT